MRTRYPQGTYMWLEDPEVLQGWMKVRRMSYQDLGTLAGVSKQFIWKLAKGEKRTCSPQVAERIEKVLLPPPEMRSPREKDLFVEKRPVGVSQQRRSSRVRRVSNVDGDISPISSDPQDRLTA